MTASAACGLGAYRAHISTLVHTIEQKHPIFSRAARGELSGHWGTPPGVVTECKDILASCGFTITCDIAADPETTLVPDDWYGPFHHDPERRTSLGTGMPWQCPPAATGTGIIWCNPPYARVSEFTQAAALKGGAPVAFLVFGRFDTRWYHVHVHPHLRGLWVRKGRIRFIDPITQKVALSAPAPSILAIVQRDGKKLTPFDLGLWKGLGPV